MFVGRVLLVIGVERFGADVAIGRIEQHAERGMAQLDRLALLILDRAELDVRVVQLAEDVFGRLGHLGLHGQQLLFFLA